MKTASLLAGFQFDNVSSSWAWLWIVLTIAGAAILVATYWGIFQRSERRLTWALMLLRGVGLAALLLALAKPSWTGETQLVDAGRVAIIVDNSESMSLPDPSGKSRYTLATEAVERLRKALAEHPSGSRLVVNLFDITGNPCPTNELPAKASVPRTDLALALANAVSGMRVKRLNGVVLISDGMDTAGREDFKEFGQKFGVPIYTVGFKHDQTLGDFDLAIKPVKNPPKEVMVNNQVRIDLLVSKTGGPKTNATVVIKRGLEERFAKKKIALPQGSHERTVSLTFMPAQAGTFEYTAAVESDKGEQNLANNSYRFPLQVKSERIRVLYVEGFLRQEYTFLKRHLENDPDLRLLPIIRRVNPEAADRKRAEDVLTRDRLKNFDVVILGDMEANFLSEHEYDALLAWLDKKGTKGGEHALLVLGGYRSFGPDGFRKTRLADALPVVFAKSAPYQSEASFQLELTEAGRGHALFSVSDDRVQTGQAWLRAPKLAGCSLVQKAKPAAQVLAVNPDLRIGGKPAIVAAVQRYGAGHSMVLTVDTTWRWSRFTRILGGTDTLYARFWSQTIRWLAGRGNDDKRPLLTVGTDQLGYDAGKQVSVKVVRHPRPDVDLAKAKLTVSYKPVGTSAKPVTVAVRNSSAHPDIFTGSFFPVAGAMPGAGGRYEVSAALTSGGKALANQGTEFVVHGSSQELLNTGTNPTNLEDLARSSGGVYREVGHAEDLAQSIPRRERRIVQTAHVDYWNSPVLFLIFIGAVSTEWFVRRRSHLV
jgi:uncharacterized membrane protein